MASQLELTHRGIIQQQELEEDHWEEDLLMEELPMQGVHERVTIRVEEVKTKDQEIQEDQEDLVDQVDAQMILMIGVQIQMHIGIQEMDGLQFVGLVEKEVNQDQLDKT